MFRYHSEGARRARARRARDARRFGVPADRRNFDGRHPLDCGRTNCVVCHGDKVYGVKSRQVLRADVTFAEGCD